MRLDRILKSLYKQGLDVSRAEDVYRIRVPGMAGADGVVAEVLLPEDFLVEAKAFRQLRDLAAASHPGGGAVTHVCATPDFHPGDSGVAIGSVVRSVGQVIPQAVGTDINCGMRLHALELEG